MTEKIIYITCKKGHNLCFVWSDKLQRFGFTCDICKLNTVFANTEQGVVEIKLVDLTDPEIKTLIEKLKA